MCITYLRILIFIISSPNKYEMVNKNALIDFDLVK